MVVESRRNLVLACENTVILVSVIHYADSGSNSPEVALTSTTLCLNYIMPTLLVYHQHQNSTRTETIGNYTS